jgi:hypothetical protein
MEDFMTFDEVVDSLPEEVKHSLQWKSEMEPYVPLRVDGSSGDAALEACMAHIFSLVLEIFKVKQHDYGPANIAEAGEEGVATRANDKTKRLRQLVGNGQDPAVAGETVDDTWLDLSDYGAIGYAVRQGWWPGATEAAAEPRIVIRAGKVYAEEGPVRVELPPATDIFGLTVADLIGLASEELCLQQDS